MAKGWKCRAYYNYNPFVGGCLHETVGPMPIFPFFGPTVLFHVDFSIVQGLWLGSFISVGHNKQIVSDHCKLIGRASDAGLGIPHISIPPTFFNILTSLFAMSNSVWGSSAVTIGCKNLLWGNQDCDTACTPFGPVPFSINLACFDPICAPTDVVVLWGSVYVSMSWADIGAAMLDIALAVAMDVGVRCLGSVAKKVAQRGLSKLAKAGLSAGELAAEDSMSTGWRKVARQWAGEAASDEGEAYMKKAAKVSAMKDALKMSDEELQTFAKESGIKSVEELKSLKTSLRDAVLDFGDVAVKDAKLAGKEAISDGIADIKILGKDIADDTIKDALKQSILKDSLKELEEATGKLAFSEHAWAMELKFGLSGVGKAFVTHLVTWGNLLGDGTSGGLLSFHGLGWTNLAHASREHSQQFYWNLEASDFTGPWNDVTSGVTGAYDTTADALGSAWSDTASGVTGAWNDTADWTTGAWNTIANGSTESWDATADWFSGLGQTSASDEDYWYGDDTETTSSSSSAAASSTDATTEHDYWYSGGTSSTSTATTS